MPSAPAVLTPNLNHQIPAIDLPAPVACRKVLIVATGMRYEHLGVVKTFVDSEDVGLFAKIDLRLSLVKDPAVSVGHKENGTMPRTACCVFGQDAFPRVVASLVEGLLSNVDLVGACVYCNKGFGELQITLTRK